MSDCDIDNKTLLCRVCGESVSSPNTRRNCGTRQARPGAGLGDMVAAGLDAVGVTKERAQAIASAIGIKDCGCQQRQQKWNEWGAKHLGIGVPKQP